MILLNLQLAIEGAHPKPALVKTPFLGGVLHGTFENLVRTHAPAIADQLGMTQKGQQKYYAVLPPPYGWQAQIESDHIYMGCGIMLFGHAQKHTETLIRLIQQWQEIRLEGRIDKIRSIKIYCCAPGHQPHLCDGSTDQAIYAVEPNYNHGFPASNGVKINLLTPLTLKSDEHKTAGVANKPPKLIRFIRSLTRRIQKIEPGLADSLNIGSLAWIKAEEQIRHAPIGDLQLETVQWKYGSRTKPRHIFRHGLIGQIHYPYEIPANINALLHWGSWLGVGQSTAMGQGMYYVKDAIR